MVQLLLRGVHDNDTSYFEKTWFGCIDFVNTFIYLICGHKYTFN